MGGRCTHSKAPAAPAATSSSSLPASSLPHLPSECVEAIIGKLPRNCISLAVRQLSKEWRQRYLLSTVIKVGGPLATAYLPPWAVLNELQRLRGRHRRERQQKLLRAMARCGDLAGLQQLAQHKEVTNLLCSDMGDAVMYTAWGYGRTDIVHWLIDEQGCYWPPPTLRCNCISLARLCRCCLCCRCC